MFTTKWITNKQGMWSVAYMGSSIFHHASTSLQQETNVTSHLDSLGQPVNTNESLITLTFVFSMMPKK